MNVGFVMWLKLSGGFKCCELFTIQQMVNGKDMHPFSLLKTMLFDV